MDRSGVNRVNPAYFGSAEPSYYGLNVTYLPGGPAFTLDAIGATVLSGV